MQTACRTWKRHVSLNYPSAHPSASLSCSWISLAPNYRKPLGKLPGKCLGTRRRGATTRQPHRSCRGTLTFSEQPQGFRVQMSHSASPPRGPAWAPRLLPPAPRQRLSSLLSVESTQPGSGSWSHPALPFLCPLHFQGVGCLCLDTVCLVLINYHPACFSSPESENCPQGGEERVRAPERCRRPASE